MQFIHTPARTMKRLQAIPLLLGLLIATTATQLGAQTSDEKASIPMTREQVKMERDEFLKTHRWDYTSDNWVLKSGVEPPKGMKSRAEIIAECNEFLRKHRWDLKSDSWLPMETPKNMSTQTRAQVKADTAKFLSTHEWNDNQGIWMEKASRQKNSLNQIEPDTSSRLA